MKDNVIPKAAPETTLEAYGRIQDLADAVGALRVAAKSSTHKLTLPEGVEAELVKSQEALKEAHRLVESKLSSHVILRPYEGAKLTGGSKAPSLSAVPPEGVHFAREYIKAAKARAREAKHEAEVAKQHDDTPKGFAAYTHFKTEELKHYALAAGAELVLQHLAGPSALVGL